MRKTDVLTLIDYLYWVNWRILNAAQPLTSDEFTAATTVATRDLTATLVHELDVEWSWRLNLQGRPGQADAELNPDAYPDVRSIAEHWRRDEAEMRAWLDSVTDGQLAADVYSEQMEEPPSLAIPCAHRHARGSAAGGHAATLLSLAGRSPGDLGFLDYLSSVIPEGWRR